MLNFKAFFVAILATFSLGLSVLQAQVYDPVDWTFEMSPKGDNYVLTFKATIEAGWHVYAQELPSDEGPLPTEFMFTKSSDYKRVGKTKEGEFITHYDPNFDMDLNYFENEAVFTQEIKRKTAEAFAVKGEFSYMVCNEEMCLPPDYVEFSFDIPAGEVASAAPASAVPDLSGMNGGDSGILDPIKWEFSLENETPTEVTFVATATIDEGWHLYSAVADPDAGPDSPIPTAVIFDESDAFAAVGDLEEEKPHIKYDPNFDMDVGSHDGVVSFRQKIEKKSSKDAQITGYVSFMTCDDSKCIFPPDVYFELDIKAGSTDSLQSSVSDSEPKTIGSEKGEKRSNWGIFIISFLSGFAALLTPCVFPMIPMTVSFFTKQSKTRAAGIKNAILYGLSIIVIYVALGVGVTAIFGASVLSELATDPWFNLFFFALLIVFAISFLGAFEITLPSSWVNKADANADKGGLIGIFFMAFTLALVSFSCTGPIVGTLIVEAASKGGLAPMIGMLGFSLAIALPFALFAAFPGWLNSLPQSGGWLNSVKVVLGFLELALAFKFLSNADLVLQKHLLERELFIAIWIVIFGMLTLYLLGKIKLPHDSDLKHVSVTRLLLAVVTGMFTIYMIPGLWGAPLKLIAAFPPPLQYSESPKGVGFVGGGDGGGDGHALDHPEKHVGPQNIPVFHDYDQGLAFAKENGKPLMLDFTGWACVNCRKMEQNVWSDQQIKDMLANDVILVSLYVDEKLPLPESEQKTVELGGGRKRKLRRVGDKWAAFQELKYGVNAQPYYVLLDHNEEMLIEPANYQDYGEIDLFTDWLQRGIEKFGGSEH